APLAGVMPRAGRATQAGRPAAAGADAAGVCVAHAPNDAVLVSRDRPVVVATVSQQSPRDDTARERARQL
ncbi:MAG: hypothetical protein J2P32_05905, partial [Actinobacteria bacterium]|nr:hypothetical protein [Actinomycetota bacterium]